MNVVILTGRLTRDPELKFGQSGKAYSRFSIAVNNPFKKDEPDFVNCVAFGKTAEIIGEYMRKGRKIGVTGRLQMSKYEVNGEKRTSYDVQVDQVEFLEGRGDNADSSSQQNSEGTSSAPKAAASKADDTSSFDDDEFPF
ncbi:MAG: single-stranded DNA-binding protein [Fusobacteriaceae bacterium]